MKSDQILQSWRLNASGWIKVMEEETIASRKITNPAIVEVIRKWNPVKVLDLGCGEGWLSRELNNRNIETIGIDATEILISKAKKKSEGHYYTQSFEQIIKGEKIPEAPYEAVVFNFCLYLKEETEHILTTIQKHLKGRRLIFIQTLHPFAFLDTDFIYKDQWLEDSWKGLQGSFTSPHHWYYRTLAGWLTTIREARLQVVNITEPVFSGATKPASIIFTLTNSNGR